MKAPELIREVEGGTDTANLNEAEARFFKQHGYLVKRGLLKGEPCLHDAIEHLWSQVPRQILRRDDPKTWLADPAKHWTSEDHERVGLLWGTNWKARAKTGIGTESFLVKDLASHPLMLELASAFLGGPIKPVDRVRGIYAVLPKPVDREDTLHPHGDYMASHVSAMVLLHETKPRTGGFTIWPGSHLRLHTQWDRVQGSTISGEKVSGYPTTRDDILCDTVPLEFFGEGGDVIFWHPRLLHSAGVNYSAETADPIVRLIVPCDYQLAGRTYVDDLQYGPGPKYQWWVDTRNIAEYIASSANNMWHDWAI